MNATEYLLVSLMEEAAEVQQACSKALRFGLDDVYPPVGKSNRELLVQELIDFEAVRRILWIKDVIPDYPADAEARISAKIQKVNRWKNYARRNGTLQEERP